MAQASQKEESQDRQDKASTHHPGRIESPCQRGHQQRSNDVRAHQRHHPEAGLERRQSQYELKVLGDEDVAPERDEGCEGVRGQ